MELIIAAVLALPLYLAAGISVAQWQYSTLNNAPLPEGKQEALNELNQKLKDLSHDRYCDTRYGYSCDCKIRGHKKKINDEIVELRGNVEPQMSTIVTWPGYLLKRAALKVYTPRPKPVPVYENYDEVSGAAVEPEVNWDSPHMAKVKAMMEDAERRKARESDPLHQKLTESWAKVEQAYSDDFLSDEEKKMVASAQQRAQEFLNYNPNNPLNMTAPEIPMVVGKKP